jgi:predicted Zn finger-like uncharacterized protein
MALFITQCPHCHTTFRTSVSQLQSADGMVRCGACLRVFVADDHLLPSADLQTLDKPLGAANDEADDEDEPPLTEPEPEPETQETIEVPEVPEPVFTFVEAPEPVAQSDAGTHIAEENRPLAVEPADQDMPVNASLPVEPLSAQPELAAVQKDSLRDVTAFNALDDFILPGDPAPAALDNIAAASASVEFDWDGNAGQKSRSGWWNFFAVVLLSTLGFQATYSLWDELGQNDTLRPWLERLCNVLPCSLAQRVDLQSIRTDNLLVHGHPEFANALRVTLILRNDSAFEQALPLLNLRLTDEDNSTVAQRQFLPSHYLPAELQNLQGLPPDTPIQIALDIIDPGIRAINYEVSFSSGDPL